MATKKRIAPDAITLNYSARFQLEYQSGERAKIGVAAYQPYPKADSVALTVVRYSADGRAAHHATAVMTAKEVEELCLCLQGASRSGDARKHLEKGSQPHRLI